MTNLDQTVCASSSFDIDAEVASSWQVSNEQVTLAPGESKQVVISVSSSVDTQNGEYSLSIVVAHVEQPESRIQ